MHSKIFASPGFKHRQQYRAAKLDAKPARSGGGMSSTVTKNFRYMRCQDFSPLPRRERRAYPSAVCEERATPAAAKKTATRRAAPDLTGGFVAPQSQSAGGYAPSSRLATGQI